MSIFFRGSKNYTKIKAFEKAIKKRDGNLVREYLSHNPSLLNARFGEYMTPIKLAAQLGYLDFVKLFVKKGAEVYSNPMASYPAVMDAAWSKQQHVVDYFLKEIPEKAIGTNGLGVAINLAARQGWNDIVTKHIERDPLVVHQRGWIGDTPLHWSCHNGYANIVTQLLDNGADIEADEINWIGGRPLHWASEHAPKTTKILLNHGAQVNVINIKEGSKCLGRTPLIHNAAQGEDCSQITEMLLNAGANISTKEANGKTAMDMAKEKNNVKIIAVLESFGRSN